MTYPVPGSLVRKLDDGLRGRVKRVHPDRHGAELDVVWSIPSVPAAIGLRHVGSGYQAQDEVLDVPPHETKESLGHGIVVQTRTLGGMEQVLVDFWVAGMQVWLPWQRLAAVAGARLRFLAGQAPSPEANESFRLRNLAFALEQWNSNTGALAQLNIDPLPHQIHLVHRILASGNLNWLVADDVGLGKTIEVGLLLTALKQRGFRRFLLVVPAGLTQQWQEEMRDKFAMSEFLVYGRDFQVTEPAHWRQFDHVIGSVDSLKREEHTAAVANAEPWDLVVFDEAHRLSRAEYGFKYDVSDRYRLAEMLRGRAENVLLLTGTPHQGRDDRFRGLLELLRPGEAWRKRFLRLRTDPGILSEMIIRNRKADVTDAEGRFIFKGKVSNTIRVELSPGEREFDQALSEYLKTGYAVSQSGGTQARAIGFVMTTYRKLAASSLPAILRGLERRLERLRGFLDQGSGNQAPVVEPPGADEGDERYVESDEERVTAAAEFFAGEADAVAGLIAQARRLVPIDSKLRFFLDGLVGSALAQDASQRVLVFTEYRTTQSHLVRALSERFGAEKVSVIHGGMDLDERRESVRAFETDGQFLVSTEAGGEGLNLHHGCHILVNYDLPWNPMRLVQRVGRLYRYGQKRTVVVFNVQVPDTLDNEILQRMYDRLEVVAQEMAAVSSEYRENLKEDILGELAEAIDVQGILEAAEGFNLEHTDDRIEAALELARQAVERQDELLASAVRYDPSELADELVFDMDHVKAFVGGMLAVVGGAVEGELYGGDVWDVRLPERMQKALAMNQNQRLCFDREVYRRVRNVHLVGADSPVFMYLLSTARAFEFGGHTARVPIPGATEVMSSMLRWQDDRGRTLRQEYMAMVRGSDGTVVTNPPTWSEWLKAPSEPRTEAGAVKPGEAVFPAFEDAVRDRLRKRTNPVMYPNSWYLVSAGWGIPAVGVTVEKVERRLSVGAASAGDPLEIHGEDRPQGARRGDSES